MSAIEILRVPEPEHARALLAEAAELNPGPWVSHSEYVADAARTIAVQLAELDADAAFSMGLLHDIGRREGRTFLRHTIDGFNYLMNLGFDEVARICLTHSFPVKEVRAAAKWDFKDREADFVQEFLSSVKYDYYDKLIQLCDGISMASGYCLLEKRMVNVGLRHGVNEFTVEKWRARFQVKDEIEAMLGRSIYSLLDGVVEETFGFNPKRE